MSRYLILSLALAGCASSSAEDRAVERFRSRTVERTAVEAPAVVVAAPDLTPRLDDLESRVAALEASVAVLSLAPDPVPQAEPEPTPAPPKAEIAEAKRIVRIRGVATDADEFIRTWYRRMWSYPGRIERHLVEHEVTGFAALTHNEQEKLHSAIHESERSTRTVSKSRVTTTAPRAVQNCPTGVCPLPQRTYTVRRYGRRVR